MKYKKVLKLIKKYNLNDTFFIYEDKEESDIISFAQSLVLTLHFIINFEGSSLNDYSFGIENAPQTFAQDLELYSRNSKNFETILDKTKCMIILRELIDNKIFYKKDDKFVLTKNGDRFVNEVIKILNLNLNNIIEKSQKIYNIRSEPFLGFLSKLNVPGRSCLELEDYMYCFLHDLIK